MPQMSPLLWSILFIYFLLLFFMFNIMNYFNIIIQPLKNQIEKEDLNKTSNLITNKPLNWKW